MTAHAHGTRRRASTGGRDGPSLLVPIPVSRRPRRRSYNEIDAAGGGGPGPGLPRALLPATRTYGVPSHGHAANGGSPGVPKLPRYLAKIEGGGWRGLHASEGAGAVMLGPGAVRVPGGGAGSAGSAGSAGRAGGSEAGDGDGGDDDGGHAKRVLNGGHKGKSFALEKFICDKKGAVKQAERKAEKKHSDKMQKEKRFLEAIADKQRERNRKWKQEEEKNQAAAKIQAILRGNRLRKEMAIMKTLGTVKK